MTDWPHVGYPVGTGAGGNRGVVEVTVDEAVVDAEEGWSGVELDAEEDASEFNDGVDVADVVEAFVEVADCVVVEAGVVLEADSDVDVVVDVATTGVDEGVEVLDEVAARSVNVEEDAVLVVELDAVEEDVVPEDVEVGVEDDDWSRDGEVVASDVTVDVDEEDEFAVWAEEKLTNKKPNMTNSTSAPIIPIRNGFFFIEFVILIIS